MAQGRAILQSGQIPRVDAFSWIRPGAPFFDQSWLSQVVFYALHQAGGVALLLFVQALIITLSYALLLRHTAQRMGRESGQRTAPAGALRIAALVLAGVMLVSFDNWLVRPQSYAIPLFIGFYVLLDGYRLGLSKRLWPLPLLMILWVNTHGSFVLGAALMLLVLASSYWQQRNGGSSLDRFELRNLALWSVVTLVAILVNPRGVEVLEYVKMMLTDPSNKFSAEWLSPTPRSLNDALFFAWALAFFVTLIYARRPPHGTDMLLAVAFFWLAITSGRYIIWFAVVTMPAFALALASRRTAPAQPSRRNMINTVLVTIIWLLVLPCLPWIKPSLGLPPPLGQLISPETPVRAVQALRSMPLQKRPRRLFHSPATGSYLTWAAPEQKVFIDTRFEFYPPQQWRDYLKLTDGEDTTRLLQKYRFDGMLLDRQQENTLWRTIAHKAEWRVLHRDTRFVLLQRIPR
jgi:hypothetical protein